MSHASMASAAQDSDEAQEVLPPIPPDTLGPRHEVMIFAVDSPKVKFEKMRRTAELAASAEL